MESIEHSAWGGLANNAAVVIILVLGKMLVSELVLLLLATRVIDRIKMNNLVLELYEY